MSSLNQGGPLIDAAMGVLAGGEGRAVLVVRGESMRPTLGPGDEVQVNLEPGPLRFGDLLLFRQADYLVVHRFLGTATRPDGSPCLRTRGDGMLALDPPLDRTAVRGRAIAAKRGNTWRRLSGAAPRGWAIALALHDLFWSAVAIVAARIDARVAATRPVGPLRSIVGAADRGLLLAADAIAFKILHGVAPDPASPAGRTRA